MSEESSRESRLAKSLLLEEIINNGRQKMADLIGFKPLAVVEVTPGEDENWVLKIEFIEREGIPNTMDLIGLYEIQLDHRGQLLNYSRKDMRKRGDSYN